MNDGYRPPRFVVGKVFFSLLVLYLLIVVGGRIWWGRYADRQLAMRIDAIRQRGEPLEWREMLGPPVADEQNAAVLYEKMAKDEGFKKAREMQFNLPPDTYGRIGTANVSGHLLEPKFRSETPAIVSEYLGHCQTALKLAREARGRKHCRFKDPETYNPFAVMMPNLGRCRIMANTLAVAAIKAHEAGNDQEAIEHIRDALSLAGGAARHPSLIGELVAIYFSEPLQAALEEITPGLKLGQAPAADPSQIRTLIAELLAAYPNEDLARAFMADRCNGVYVFERYRDGLSLGEGEEAASYDSFDDPLTSWWGGRVALHPVFNIAMAEFLDGFDPLIAKIRAGKQLDSGYYASQRFVDHPGYVVLRIMSPRLNKSATLLYRAQGRTRMGAVALAMRLYALEHGAAPDRLADLVPQYLPSLPADPFSDAKGTFGFMKSGKHPMLYSLGMNRRDDGGRFKVWNREYESATIDEDQLDTPFFLNGGRQAAIDEQVQAASRPATMPALEVQQ